MKNSAISMETTSPTPSNRLTFSISLEVIKYATIVIIGFFLACIGYWMLALIITPLVCLALFIKHLLDEISTMNWLDENAEISLQQIINDLENK